MTAIQGRRLGERGAALAGVLVVLYALMAIGALAYVASSTNLRGATNLKTGASAYSRAERGVTEALYRLSLPDSSPYAIVPVMTNPDWHLDVAYSTGDTNAADGRVSTLEHAADWPPGAGASTTLVSLRFAKTPDGKVLSYDRTVATPNPPFLSVGLPGPVGTIVGQVYELLCAVPSVLGLQVGGVLGLCPVANGEAGQPVVRLDSVGTDAFGARREIVADVARGFAFTPLAPLMAGGDVDLNSSGFIDGVNHDHRIALGGGTIYGDDDAETTNTLSLLGLLPVAVRDSPDDNNLWTGGPLLTGPVWHGVANASLVLDFALTPLYTSFPRLFNKQISATDYTPAWTGVGQLTDVLTSSLSLPTGSLVPAAQLGVWTGFNFGYASAIALSSSATVLNPPVPPAGNSVVWNRGVFSWRVNDMNSASYAGSVNLTTSIPTAGSFVECGPAVQGDPPPIVCRPHAIATFPSLQTYLGASDPTMTALLADPDTRAANLAAGQAPLGFTFVDGDYTLASGVPSPASDQFGVLYVRGDLTVEGTHTHKGLVFVEGDLRIATGAHLEVLGSVMVRDTVTNVGTGRMTIVYSREAALRGLAATRPWRVLTWLDPTLQN